MLETHCRPITTRFDRAMEPEAFLEDVSIYTVFLALLVLPLTWLVIKRHRNNSDGPTYTLPPGPRRWPLLGNIPGMMMAGDSSKYMSDLVSQYGPVFTLYMGPRPVVVLNKYHSMKKVLLDGHLLSDRGSLPALEDYFKGRGVIGSHYTAYWKKTRNFVIHSLRHFGVERQSFEGVIASEADNLIKGIRERGTLDPLMNLQSSTCNVICGVVFGNQYSLDDPQFVDLLDTLYKSLRAIEYAAVSSLVPGLHYLPGCSYQKFYGHMDKLMQFFREEINAHDQISDPDCPHDLIDMYLSEIHRTTPEDPTYGLFSKTNLQFVVNDLFMAGTETLATVLYWAILLLGSHPSIQERLHKEMDDVTYDCDHVTLADGASMPYTKATIDECLRYASVAISSMRSTTSAMTIDKYHLEVGTWIMLNYEYSSFDPECWPEPRKFKPERFLDEHGQYCPDEHLISFSLGKRNCIGEKLGRMELFLFFANIIKNFELAFPDDAPHPSLEAVPGGMVRTPHRYRVSFKDRKASVT
ncbi:cytochrome P450 2C16-like [Lytechinus pictus]|uniref:cytochrome P450 2C16-like n=1 Tax=Lytechinus pictus TaxID=7653 RepID=UPI0030BA2AB2